MLLSNKASEILIPHTSICVIHTTGVICDGDEITITSPIFASTNLISKSINLSDRFIVKVKIINKESIENNLPDGEFMGTLVCDDNDVFNMYVKI